MVHAFIGKDKFQSTLPAGGATTALMWADVDFDISIHAPRGGSDRSGAGEPAPYGYFNPRSPRGERPLVSAWTARPPIFQSTLPAGGATRQKSKTSSVGLKFQSTLPAGGATCEQHADDPFFTDISIHAPRGGSDDLDSGFAIKEENFNPRSPRGERLVLCRMADIDTEISIHAPRGGSDFEEGDPTALGHISIHAPRGGSDLPLGQTAPVITDFNPRSPRGERPLLSYGYFHPFQDFNPRSPRGERRVTPNNLIADLDFNPRSPRGERLLSSGPKLDGSGHFNPRSPRGERRPSLGNFSPALWISIHAPRGGSDHLRHTAPEGTRYFNPRSPRGERP